MIQPLITKDEIAQYKQISKTPNNDKINQIINEAQLLDVSVLLGNEFFNKIIKDPSSYTDLLDGGDYIYKDVTYTNYGLKMVIIYYTWARYVMFGSQIDTPFSMVEKLNGDKSQPVSEASKKSAYSTSRDEAFQLWENVRLYLIRTDNPDYKKCKIPPNSRGFRMTKIN